MNRREFLQTGTLASFAAISLPAAFSAPATPANGSVCDVFVYGSTPGGVAAAIEAAQRGCKVILACPQGHPGGMSASGLCTTDAVRRQLFGGLVIEFIDRVRALYEKKIGRQSSDWKLIQDGWFYEPSVAEQVFTEMLQAESTRLDYRPRHHLLTATVKRGRVTTVELEDAKAQRLTITAKTFIDGTYEGDLAAAAKVPYRVGRESRDEYGESKAGIHYMNFRTGQQIITPDTGEASPAIQSYCARCIFTTDPQHRLPIDKPATYDEHLPDFEPLLKDFASGRLKHWSSGTRLPGGKVEVNGAIEWLTSFNCPGVSWTWPEASRHHRARLAQFHIDHAAGMMWFLQNDSRVPADIKAQVADWGLHDQEFTDNGHWPWQIYVRQGRRILGRDIVTQHNFTIDPQTKRTPKVAHPVAMGEHSFDIHPCHDRRFAVEGFMEGVLWYPKKALGPAQPGQIPWGALLPPKIDNLLVPVAMSSTHIAMSVLRMEPVWMTTGQIAGLAAAVAKETGHAVAHIDPDPLPRTLKLTIDTYAG